MKLIRTKKDFMKLKEDELFFVYDKRTKIVHQCKIKKDYGRAIYIRTHQRVGCYLLYLWDTDTNELVENRTAFSKAVSSGNFSFSIA